MAGRLRQGLRALGFSAASTAVPDDLRSLCRPGTLDIFQRLSPFERAHMIDVAVRLRRDGAGDALIIAGLLHDIGKGAGSRHPSLPERVGFVLAGRIAPLFLDWLRARLVAPPWCVGSWTLVHHARLGSDIVRGLGYDDEVCALVELHDDKTVQSVDLRQLRAADEGRMQPYTEGLPA